jgi:hypothetical protein
MDLAITLSAINSAKDFAALIIGRKIDSVVTKKAIELQNSIIALQNSILSIQMENQSLLQDKRVLKEMLEESQNWREESTHYDLRQVAKGVFVYQLKDEYKGSQAAAWLCTNCFEAGRKSIL